MANRKIKKWIANEPYNNLPKLPPIDINLETSNILKACISARAALAELKQLAEHIPNQAMLISILPKLEAKASSEIENIVTSTDKLFQYENDGHKPDSATKETLDYSRALLQGYRSLKKTPLGTRIAEEICSTIKQTEMHVRKVPGTDLKNRLTGEVIYTPPVGESLLRDLLKNWEDFLHNEKQIDPLIRMAVGHYQFEAIHPFTDGNGRTGRILNNLFLIDEGLLTLPILFLSRYIILHREEYYKLLLDITKSKKWEDWILFVLKGVEETSLWTNKKILAIRDLIEETKKHVKNNAPKIYSHELISLIFELPYCRIQNIVEKKIVGRESASKYLKQLVKLGVLKEIHIGREKLFLHPKLMKLLMEEPNVFNKYD